GIGEARSETGPTSSRDGKVERVAGHDAEPAGDCGFLGAESGPWQLGAGRTISAAVPRKSRNDHFRALGEELWTARGISAGQERERRAMFGMTTKRKVLELIGERSAAGEATSFRTLVCELLISSDAACSHLRRLWRARLIKSTDYPSSFRRAAVFGAS